MSSFKKLEPLLLTCPYDPNHKVKPSKFKLHLIKCENNSDLKLERCRYNDDHRVAAPLMAHHYLECPDAITRMNDPLLKDWDKPEDDSEVNRLAENLGAVGLGPTPGTSATSDGWDDWESEKKPFVAPRLDGSKPIVQAGYGANSYGLQTLTPAERKKLYEQQIIETQKKQKKTELKEYQERAKKEREEREKRDQEEKEKREKEKQERDQKAKEKALKKKVAKEKEKAAKRAAFMARQAEEGDQENNQEDNQKNGVEIEKK